MVISGNYLDSFPPEILGLLPTRRRKEHRQKKNTTLVMFKNLVLVSGLDEYSHRPERYAL